MKAFSQYYDYEYEEYKKALSILEQYGSGRLDEGVLDSLTSGIKQKISFIKDVASAAKMEMSKVVELFKDSRVFTFFKTIGFSFKKLYDLLKKGYKGYQTLQKIVSDYLANTKVVKWTHKELSKFDAFLQKHPLVRKLAGPVVSGILLYIWLNMAFSGDFISDMDFTDIINALRGQFVLSDLFAGPEGIKMMMLFVTGLLGHSFPWPGATSQQLVGGVLLSLGRMFKKGEFKR